MAQSLQNDNTGNSVDRESGDGILFSIVVPCYKSGNGLDEFVRRIDTVMTALGNPFELVLVNDASPDDTWQAIERIARTYSFVRGYDLLFNVGQFKATICGFEQARGKFIITMDDDLQHPPEELPKLIAALQQHPELDCIMGAYEVKEHSFIRNLGSWFMGKISEVFYEKPPHLTLSSFRILRRQAMEAVCAHRTIKPIIGPLILKSTRRIANITVEHNPRAVGKSNYSMWKLVRTTLDNIISVSTLPLQALSLLGLVFSFGSVVLISYYLLSYSFGQLRRVPGFTTEVFLISFFGGMTLLSIGLLGEYIILIFSQTSSPPRYIVRSRIQSSAINPGAVNQ